MMRGSIQMIKRKIALVKVYFNMHSAIKSREESQKVIRRQSQSYPPLGLCYIDSYLNSKGITNVEIIDCVERKYTSIMCSEYIVKNGFDIVGISLNSFLLKEAGILIREIKRRKKKIIIVLGGVHVTYHPQIVKILKADYGIRGDGENSFYEFLVNFNHNIEGLVYIENDKVKYNKSAIAEDLNKLAFPSIIPHEYKFPICNKRTYTMISSRGCPHDCIFCGLPHKREYRSRTAENIFSEMEYLQKNGFEYIDFKDDCFAINRKQAMILCDLIINSDLRIEWGMETRADLIDYDLLKSFKKAGCNNLKFGVESGVERIRNVIINKSISDKVIFDVVNGVKS